MRAQYTYYLSKDVWQEKYANSCLHVNYLYSHLKKKNLIGIKLSYLIENEKKKINKNAIWNV